MKYKREKEICDSIRNIYDSLESHLEGTYTDLIHKAPKKYAEQIGGRAFHKRTIVEYAKDILTLAKNL